LLYLLPSNECSRHVVMCIRNIRRGKNTLKHKILTQNTCQELNLVLFLMCDCNFSLATKRSLGDSRLFGVSHSTATCKGNKFLEWVSTWLSPEGDLRLRNCKRHLGANMSTNFDGWKKENPINDMRRTELLL
jgi:hypothetical protein